MPRKPRNTPDDVQVVAHGSIYLFHLLTPAAREWVEENVSENRQMFGNALAVEWRFADNLTAGMQESGLNVR